MLTDYFPKPDPLHDVIAFAMGGSPHQKRLQEGVYERGSFGGSNYVPGWDERPGFAGGRAPYGVSDDVEQILEYIPELENDSERTFVLFVTVVRRADQESTGGWRWHKWGEYIGKHEPKHEYLYDEKDIDEVLCWHVYERTR